jgi:hypothetical protein
MKEAETNPAETNTRSRESDQTRPILIAYQGVLSGQRWQIKTDSWTLGRAEDCDIVISDRQVSRYHARIERDASGYLLRDLGSKNGTYVNDELLRGQPYRLQDGDEIELATVIQLGFVSGEATLPLTGDLGQPGGLQLDEAARQVYLGRQILDPPLSPPQFRLLSILVEADGDVVTRERVIDEVWPEAVGGVTDQAVDALIYRLRERLAELDPDHNYVVTVRGHGFRYEPRALSDFV